MAQQTLLQCLLQDVQKANKARQAREKSFAPLGGTYIVPALYSEPSAMETCPARCHVCRVIWMLACMYNVQYSKDTSSW